MTPTSRDLPYPVAALTRFILDINVVGMRLSDEALDPVATIFRSSFCPGKLLAGGMMGLSGCIFGAKLRRH
jgi:hypothetical protein